MIEERTSVPVNAVAFCPPDDGKEAMSPVIQVFSSVRSHRPL